MGKIAFVFAGQGSQIVGMGRDLFESFSSARELFSMADNDLLNLIFYGQQADLNLTINAQRALFLVDLVSAKLLAEHGIFADGIAGFSLGEIPALAFSGLLSNREAYDLVSFRAKVMHQCAGHFDGGMFAVVKISSSKVEEICSTIDGAYPVNYNCENQTIVALSATKFDELQIKVAENCGKAIKLAVSGAFHSPYMSEAAEQMKLYTQSLNFGKMRLPIYSNKTAGIYDNPAYLISSQIVSPVLWQKTIINMINDGFDTFIEVGAGRTLCNLIQKINENVHVFAVNSVATLKQTLSEVTNVKK